MVTLLPPDHADAGLLRILLVAHTHWDREWYHPAARFRQRLVALVDALLDGPGDQEPFLLDGQAITLVDYLAVRPEREPELRAALERGAVEAGPWYVLADNLIPSGEALLRNLEAGRRVLGRLGAAAPRVAYCPDSFGHPAALPAIAAGYGLPLAIVWRGLGGATHPTVDTLWWQHASGARVLVHHLPPDGYETGSALPVHPERASSRWRQLSALLGARNATGTVLLTNGADHHARQSELHRALDLARELLPERVTLERTSLHAASQQIIDAAVAFEAAGHPLPVLRGELRDSYGYTWTLQGTFATRAHQKRTNAMLERAILRDVEPWIALAHLHAGNTGDAHDGRVTMRQLPSLLTHAWDTLLSTHPHDTLCGCSVDEVARATDATQASAQTQASGLRVAALENALRHDTVAARAAAPRGSGIVVRNRCSYPRGGIAELRIDQTVGDVAVGPGSAGAAAAQVAHGTFQLAASMTAQEGARRLVHRRRESPQHYPDDDLVVEHRVVAWIPRVPAFGLRVLDPTWAEAPEAEPVRPVHVSASAGSVVLSNDLLALHVSRDGVTLRQGSRELRDALSIETRRDDGDSYTPSLRGPGERLVLRRARVGARGPLRASVVLEWTYREKARAVTPGDLSRHAPVVSPRRRNARIDVRTTLVLDAGADHVRCDVVMRNRTRDHRLQLVWSTDVSGAASVRADAAFGSVERTPVAAPAHSAEVPPSTMPLHRWASTSDAERGATLLSDGLAEAEVIGGRLAVTLVRSIGELSRADLPERPGHAGWPAAIPAAQCQGTYRARVGLLLHDSWNEHTEAHVERACDALLLPLVGESWRDLDTRVAEVPGAELAGEGLRASTVALSANGRALVLRAQNLADHATQGTWTLPGNGSWHVTECRLDETPMSETVMSGPLIDFTVPAKGLTTLRIERAGD
jgi:mannosylglycerate hydrolase